jgi:hypothetical protein
MSFGEKRNDDTASSSLSMERGMMILCLFSMAEEENGMMVLCLFSMAEEGGGRASGRGEGS